MPNWEGSDRRARLPADWDSIRKRVLQRDEYMCQWYTHTYTNAVGERIIAARCGEQATDVDHIINGDDHSMSNLQSLCSTHHRRKSGQEGAKALAMKRRQQKRKTERHPGLE